VVHLDADLAVTLPEDRPGTLAAALRCVGDAGINLDGYAEIGGIVHVLSPNLQAAHDCLLKGGFRIVQEQQVLLVAVEDEPGPHQHQVQLSGHRQPARDRGRQHAGGPRRADPPLALMGTFSERVRQGHSHRKALARAAEPEAHRRFDVEPSRERRRQREAKAEAVGAP
jgi:hypothetical protein